MRALVTALRPRLPLLRSQPHSPWLFTPANKAGRAGGAGRPCSYTLSGQREFIATRSSAGQYDYTGGETSAAPETKSIFVNNLPFDYTSDDLKDHFGSAGNVVSARVLAGRDASKGCGVVEFETAEEASKAIDTLNQTSVGGRRISVREDRGRARAPGGQRFGGNFQREDGGMRQRGAGGTQDWWDGGGEGTEPYSSPGDDGWSGGGFARGARSRDSGGRYDSSGGQSRRGPRDNGWGGGGSGRSPPPGGYVTGNRVFVGNLSYETSWQTLKDFFRQAGEVTYAKILEGRDGYSKGCGIVEFATVEEAQRAIAELSNLELDGRPLIVREDREDKNLRPPRGSSRLQVLFRGLPYSTTAEDLQALVGDSAAHVEIATALDGSSKGFGTVRFETVEAAEQAIVKFDQMIYQERLLRVTFDKFA